MKNLLLLAVTFLTLLGLGPASAHAGRNSSRELARSVRDSSRKLSKDVKDHLKDADRWKPRGRDAYLWQSIGNLSASADDLSDRLDRGWDRQALRCYAEVEANFRDVAQLIGLARDKDVRKRFAQLRERMMHLSRRVPDNGYPDYGDRDRDQRDRRDYQERGGGRATVYW